MPFEPGKSGNPGGRPKRIEELRVRVYDVTPQLADRLMDIALNGEHRDSVAAIKLFWGYGLRTV